MEDMCSTRNPEEGTCRTIERLYDVEIVFDRPEIAKYRYTGAVNEEGITAGVLGKYSKNKPGEVITGINRSVCILK